MAQSESCSLVWGAQTQAGTETSEEIEWRKDSLPKLWIDHCQD